MVFTGIISYYLKHCFIGMVSHYGTFVLAVFIMGLWSCSQNASSQDPYQMERKRMVKYQIANRGIRDSKVLAAMLNVERHQFVPEEYRDEAYNDYPLPIGEGQTISQPYIVAFMTDALDLGKDDKVLEIGTGSGYQAAVLAEICDSVYSVEIIESLGLRARNTLKELGYDNVFIRIGDGYEGWPEYAPFDCIIVTCAPTHIPQALQDQLAEGGRMIIPVGRNYSQELILLVKKDGKLKERDVLPVRFVPMIDYQGNKY